MIHKTFRTSLFLVLALGFLFNLFAQAFPGGRGGPPPTPKAGAPADLTGYWVSVIVEDWRFRMLPPKKIPAGPPSFLSVFAGALPAVPMNDEARKIAQAWDSAKDEAAGEQCKAYGAPNIMRIPGRIHITWEDDQTLKLDTDAGKQTRIFEFGTPKRKGGDWQGVSHASWDTVPGGFGGPIPTGALKVVTSSLRTGYLERNGIPYSTSAVVTEYFDRINEDASAYLLVTTSLEDPTYLTEPYLTAVQFKKEADGSHWTPSACSTK